MPKKSAKSRSKRTTLHQKYKVLKKIKEHHRKKAKELRKKGGRVKPPKDPGIPNAWPFKDQLVKELEFERERAEAAKAARKEAAKERRVRTRAGVQCRVAVREESGARGTSGRGGCVKPCGAAAAPALAWLTRSRVRACARPGAASRQRRG